MSKIWIWLPRVLSIAFVLFLSLFSFDVFAEGFSPQALLGFLIHSLPALAMLVVVLLSWKRELLGAIVFFAVAVLYIWLVGFDRPWSWYAGISGPAALVGILYLVAWIQKKKIKQNV